MPHPFPKLAKLLAKNHYLKNESVDFYRWGVGDGGAGVGSACIGTKAGDFRARGMF